MRRAVLAILLAGCASDDVVGPFSGDTHRYALYKIELPTTAALAKQFGIELEGYWEPANALGQTIRSLASDGDVTEHAADMIAGGSIATSLEITADDFASDGSVGVRYLGAPDSQSVELGGRLDDGWFRSNPITSSHAGAAQFYLPVFTEADPSIVNASRVEMILIPEVDGVDVLRADIHAAIPNDDALWNAVYLGLTQMIASDPGDHRGMLDVFDMPPKDGVITYDEVRKNQVLAAMLAPDVFIDDQPLVAFGFRAYFKLCAVGPCADSMPFDHCFDRRLDGDETDIDCGGSCRGCEAGAACVSSTDCETITCEQGHCGPPSCSDGVRDGLESDVDCGANCPSCANGQRCYMARDCASFVCGQCSSGDCQYESTCSPG